MKKLSLLLMTLLLLASCSQELVDDASGKDKGKEVMAHFSFTTAPMKQIVWGPGGATTRSVSGTVDDQLINDMWVVQFDNTGAFMKKEFSSNQDFTKFDAPLGVNGGATTSTVYFIANIGGTMDVPADETAFKTQMKTFTADSQLASTDPDTGKRSIPMYGKVTGLVVPASGTMESAVNVTLTRMVAQVDITYTVPTGMPFNLEGVRLCNVPTGVQFLAPTAAAGATATTSFTVNTLAGETITGSSTPTKITFFLPENQRGVGSNTTGTEERFKDGTGTTNATYVEFYGHVTGKLGGDKIAYRIYIGADNFNDYNIVRNTKYSITATLGGVSASDRRVNITERANCYMVTPSGSVEIPITRANESDLGVQISDVTAAGAWTPSVYWQTAAGLLTIDASTSTKGYFKVTTSGAQGNGVIVAKKADGTIVWSWHIWVISDDMNASANQFSMNSLTWMNRNLGATTASTGSGYSSASPLLYQWGRKDPFLGTDITTGTQTPFTIYNAAGTAIAAPPTTYTGFTSTIVGSGDTYTAYADVKQANIDFENGLAYSVKYPMLILQSWRGSTAKVLSNALSGIDSWGGEINQPKSLYDPCPAGWRVSSGRRTSASYVATWTSPAYAISGTGNGHYLTLVSGLPVFPLAGYRSATGVFSSVGAMATGWSATSANITGGYDLWASGTAFTQNDVTGKDVAESIRCVKNWMSQ